MSLKIQPWKLSENLISFEESVWIHLMIWSPLWTSHEKSLVFCFVLFNLQPTDHIELSYQSIFRYYHSMKGLYRFYTDEEEQNSP